MFLGVNINVVMQIIKKELTAVTTTMKLNTINTSLPFNFEDKSSGCNF